MPPAVRMRRIGLSLNAQIGVLLGVVCLLAGILYFTVYVRDPSGSLYDRALKEYRQGRFEEAVRILEAAYAAKPDSVRVNALLGWSYWRMGQSQRAEPCFARAYNLDKSVEDAALGLAYTSLANRKASVALLLLQELAAKKPDDRERHLALGEAYVKSRDILSGANVYQTLLQQDPNDQAARQEFLGLYGYPEYRPDLSLIYETHPPPQQLQIFFRTRKDYFQARIGGQWRTIYPVGVNIGPARPGEFPSTAPREFSTYFEWFKQIAQMNSNTVRLYTVLPPAFYQALKAYNESSSSPLWLIQEVWLSEQAEDLYDPPVEEEFQREIADVIDLLHGRAIIQFRDGHNYGVYTADVSRYALALAIGREAEPRLVFRTNRDHPERTSYRGRYVSLPHGNPTEAWFARMCDFAVEYELERYNAQRPLTVVNWPPLDPVAHPTEATYEEEQRIRRRLGYAFDEKLPEVPNDSDIVSLDITRFNTERGFVAGLFALYHVYQHWPDFLLHEPSYALAQDAYGANRYLGYLRELKRHHRDFPLFIGEYGVSTSLAAAHLHPQGWHNGGLTEQQQAELLVRFTRNIRETGCAGGLVFEWQDEWFKHVHDFNTPDFELPWDRNPLWMNALDPEKNFGLVGYEADFTVPLLRGNTADWQRAQRIYSAGDKSSELHAAFAMSDYAYFYLRLDTEKGPIDWASRHYWVALNSLPGESGARQLPEIGVRLAPGANFLVQLTGPSSSRILIAQNYNPNHYIQLAGTGGETRLWRKRGMTVKLEDAVPFEEIIVEVNQPRYARDGREFPALDYNRSPMTFGSADRAHAQFTSHALWKADTQQGMIELRIPWGLLLMADPSHLQAFAGTDAEAYTTSPGAWLPKSQTTRGINIAVFALRPQKAGSPVVTSSLPEGAEGKELDSVAIYTWERWNRVQVRPYFKLAYFSLRKVFGELRERPPSPRR